MVRRLLWRLLGVELMDQVVEGWSARVRRWELRLRLVVLLREELHRSAVVPREEQLVVLQLVVLVQKEKAGVLRLVQSLRTVRLGMEVAEEMLEWRSLLEKQKSEEKAEVQGRAVVMVPVLRQRALEMREGMTVLLQKLRMEMREEMMVLGVRQPRERRVPMEEGMMRANRLVVKLAKERTLGEKMPEERATVLLEMRDRARNRRSHQQR